MHKSVYSLVLMDDVVDAIDQAAYSMGTSRSNLINQVLADYVSLVTPEKRMQDVFELLRAAILPQRSLQIQEMPSGSMIAMKSTLRYKYNPTVRYSVELYRNNPEATGQLKVSLRTQSPALIEAMDVFFRLWAEVEGIDHAYYRIEPGRFTRIFTVGSQDSQVIAQHISSYIQKMDRAMKAFFEHLNYPQQAKKMIKQIYHKEG